MQTVVALLFLLCASIQSGSLLCSYIQTEPSHSSLSLYWRQQAEGTLRRKLSQLNQPMKQAKNVRTVNGCNLGHLDVTSVNVILFIGDGMGVTVETASRIYVAQTENLDSNQTPLSWQTFPAAGMVQTYDVDRHTADSASSATAILSGIKAQFYTLGVDSDVGKGDCNRSLLDPPESIADWALAAGKKVGLVSTTRLTHATSGALYAHAADRDWEDSSELPASASQCQDIALQFVTQSPGNQLLVALAGGRANFLPNTTADYENATLTGRRTDDRNLIDEWVERTGGDFVWNDEQLEALEVSSDKQLLGLFAHSHMEYQLVVDKADNAARNPTLTQMTKAAIEKLAANTKSVDEGYFLLVEAGRIDHGLHFNKAKLALGEAHELHRAVRLADELTSPDDTLIVVTADHSHVLSMIGYPDRSLNILDKFDPSGPFLLPDQPLTTILQFANGPQRLAYPEGQILNDVDTMADVFMQPTHLPARWETHGGEDVAIWARGPSQLLFTGLIDNTFIARAIGFSLCVGASSLSACTEREQDDITTNKPPVSTECGAPVLLIVITVMTVLIAVGLFATVVLLLSLTLK